MSGVASDMEKNNKTKLVYASDNHDTLAAPAKSKFSKFGNSKFLNYNFKKSQSPSSVNISEPNKSFRKVEIISEEFPEIEERVATMEPKIMVPSSQLYHQQRPSVDTRKRSISVNKIFKEDEFEKFKQALENNPPI